MPCPVDGDWIARERLLDNPIERAVCRGARPRVVEQRIDAVVDAQAASAAAKHVLDIAVCAGCDGNVDLGRPSACMDAVMLFALLRVQPQRAMHSADGLGSRA